MQKRVLITILITFLFLLFIGCTNSNDETLKEQEIIKIGIFPIGDMLPLLVGIEEGFFDDEGVTLELVPFQSAVEKESAFQAGNLDGIITDMIVAHLLKNTGIPVEIGSLTLGVESNEGPFGIVSSPKTGITSIQELEGKKVAMSYNTIIEYVLDGILIQEGLNEDFIEKVPVPNMSVRMEMLLEGQVDAAVLPEPLLTLAQMQGANLVIDDTQGQNLSQVVLLFNSDFVDNNKESLKKFYRGYIKAVKAINSNPENYHQIFVEETRVPEAIKDIYKIPEFPEPELPLEDDMLRVQDWLLSKGLIDDYIKYEDMIADELY